MTSAFFRLFVLSLLALVLVGCSVERPVSQAEALELLDRGVKALRVQDLLHARLLFELAEETAPSAQSADGLGCVELLKGDLPAAEKFFRLALERRAEDSPAVYLPAVHHLALVADMRGDSAEAERYYRAVVKQDPFNVRARTDWGVFLATRGADQEAAARELHLVESLIEHPIVQGNLQQLSKVKHE